MTVIGSASSWLDIIDQWLPDILEAILDTWQGLQVTSLPKNWEDNLTDILCRQLRKNKIVRERQLPFYIEAQRVELEPADGQKLGRMDLNFLPTGGPGSPSEEIYFCMECKRLNFFSNRKRKGSEEYVSEGMIRFVNGQYAKAVLHGGMLGYVYDGNISKAMQNVQTSVKKHCNELCMEPPGILHSSAVLIETSVARQSTHNRKGGLGLLHIHHLFVKADHFSITPVGILPATDVEIKQHDVPTANT